MKFSINQSELQNALSVVLKGIATRSTLPILSGIYLDAHDDTLTLQATDLELSIQYSVSALIEETGKAVQLSAVAQDVGSAQETLSCEGEGEDVEIAFNYAYVLDGLSSVSTDNVFLEVQSSMKPGIFKADEGENFLYLVMPVRIS